MPYAAITAGSPTLTSAVANSTASGYTQLSPSEERKWREWNLLLHVRLCYPMEKSMGFSRPEHWNGEPFPSPGDLPKPGIELRFPALQADSYSWAVKEAQSESERCSVMSDSLWPHRLYSPWNSPGQNTRVGSRPLLQGIFPTLGSNPCLLHWQADS